MKATCYRFRRTTIWMAAMSVVAGVVAWEGLAQPEPGLSSSTVLARGGGTTIIEGGTGKSGGFVPVLTTVGFHAERNGGSVTGTFECLARAPQNPTGSASAQFNVNAMYVTGQITAATLAGDMATLAGTADITGIGAGTNVPFTFVVRAGGPGSAAVLTTEGSARLVFNETLVEGSFQVGVKHRDD